MIKITHISDTHGQHRNYYLSKGDILVHSGDAELVTDSHIDNFAIWLASQKYKTKIFVPGDHDFFVEENLEISRNIFNYYNIIMLINESVYINDLQFYGSPYTPQYGKGAFMLDSEGMKQQALNIPMSTNILITHGPPKYVLDNPGRGPVGCDHLSHKVTALNPKIHMFGHVHEGYGAKYFMETLYINSAVNSTLPQSRKSAHSILLNKDNDILAYYPETGD